MSEFEFEELMAEVLDVSDEAREDDDYLPRLFESTFNMPMAAGYALAKALLPYTPLVKAGYDDRVFNAFVSRLGPAMLMKMEAKAKGSE